MNCLFCGGGKVTVVGEVDYPGFDKAKYGTKSSLVECPRCGLFCVIPRIRENKADEFYTHDYHYNRNRRLDGLIMWFNALYMKSDARLIKKYVRGGKILDVGFGRGDMLKFFSNTHWQRYGYELSVSEKDKARLKREFQMEVVTGKSLENIFPCDFFDVVILRNVLEHTFYFRELLSEIYRILKKQGVLFIRTPNINSLDFKLFKNNWYVVNMRGHLVFFSKGTLSALVHEIGFEASYLKPTRFSAPLSFYRSFGFKEKTLLKRVGFLKFLLIPFSILGSLLPLFTGGGGDLRVILRKRLRKR